MAADFLKTAAPWSIWIYYTRIQTALAILRRQWPASQPEPLSQLKGFEGMSRAEFEESLSELRRELDGQVTLALVASFEARIQNDFRTRTDGRFKDPVSRDLRRLKKELGKGQRLDLTTILDVYKDKLGIATAVGHFKQLLNHRHWLAHGRHWVDKSGISTDPGDAWDRGTALLSRIPPIGSTDYGG